VIQVVDLAVTPDKRSSPKRLAILLASMIFALCGASFWIVYRSNEVNARTNRIAAPIATMLLVLLAMIPVLSAQTPENPGQPVPCSTSADSSQETSCADSQPDTSVAPSNPQSLQDDSRTRTSAEPAGRERRRNAEETSTKTMRIQDRRTIPARRRAGGCGPRRGPDRPAPGAQWLPTWRPARRWRGSSRSARLPLQPAVPRWRSPGRPIRRPARSASPGAFQALAGSSAAR